MSRADRSRIALLTFQEQRRDREEEQFIRWLNPQTTDRIFDVGTNTGQFLTKLRDHYGVQQVAGCDSNPHVARPELHIYQLSAEQLTGIADEAYTRVTMRHVLEHTADPAAALTEAHRISAPSGTLHIACFLYTPELVQHSSVTEAITEPPHQFTQDQLVQLVSVAGFTIEQQDIVTELSSMPQGDAQFPSLLIVARKSEGK